MVVVDDVDWMSIGKSLRGSATGTAGYHLWASIYHGCVRIWQVTSIGQYAESVPLTLTALRTDRQSSSPVLPI